MKNLFKVMCLLLLSMGILISCEKEDLVTVEENNVVETDSDNSSRLKGYTTLNVDWYGDQYLAEASNKTHALVNTHVRYAARRIKDQTDLTSYNVYHHWDSWESSGTTNKALLKDFCDDYTNGSKCNLKLGITYERATNSQGIAHGPGYYCIADTQPDADMTDVWDWPDYSIFMHELSHNLDADHCDNYCVMNYDYAGIGTTNLCSDCEDEINRYL